MPSPVAATLARVTKAIGRPSFRVIGGAALDLLEDPNAVPHDIDVVLPLDAPVAIAVLAHVAGSGGTPVSPFRRYWIGGALPVLMVLVRVDDLVLDLNFLDAVDRIGCFDLESLQWVAPEGIVRDDFGAQTARGNRRVRLIRPIDDENPFLLLARFLRLAAKYRLDLEDDAHRSLLADLAARTREWTATDDFNGRQAWESHLRALARVVIAAQDSAAVVTQLARAGVPAADVLGDPLEVGAAEPPAGTTTAASFWTRVREAHAGSSGRADPALDLDAIGSPLTARPPRRLRSDHPLVGIVVPTRDEAGFVGAAFESLARQRRGDGRPFDDGAVAVTIVDGGSRDATLEVVEESKRAFPHLRVEVVEHAEPSMVSSRAAGFRRFLDRRTAAPPYFVSIDADTVFPEGWLDALLAPLDEGCDMAVSSGWFEPELWARCPNLAQRYLEEVGTLFFDPVTIERLDVGGEETLFTEQVFVDMGRPVSDCGFAMTAALYEVLGGFYPEHYTATGDEIPAVGWPFEFRAHAVGARIGWARQPGYLTSARRLLGDPNALFDGSAYIREVEAFRQASSRHEWLDSAADRLDWDSLRAYIVKNYVLQRCILAPARLARNPGYFGSAVDALAAAISRFRLEPGWWSAPRVFDFADELLGIFGDAVLASQRARAAK